MIARKSRSSSSVAVVVAARVGALAASTEYPFYLVELDLLDAPIVKLVRMLAWFAIFGDRVPFQAKTALTNR